MTKKLSFKQQKIIIEKLKKIIGKEKKRKYPKQDIEIENARIKNITQGLSAYGAQPQNFVGMLTFTVAGKENRISPFDDLDIIIRKTKVAYDSMIYYIDNLRRFLKKKNFEFIYLMVFELQKDGNLHTHIYFSIPLNAFPDFFVYYHNYKKNFTKPKILKNKTIIPLGRSQLGISMKFMEKLIQAGFKFEAYENPEKPERLDWRCVNFVTKSEFKTGNWPTLFFYTEKNLSKMYSEKIVEYLRKNYEKKVIQKTVGSQFSRHHTKTIYDSDEWSEIQKKFIRKVCGKVYTASRLPIPVFKYQKKRKEIMKLYPTYTNLNTLISDCLNGIATYKNGILTCPNGKKLRLT